MNTSIHYREPCATTRLLNERVATVAALAGVDDVCVHLSSACRPQDEDTVSTNSTAATATATATAAATAAASSDGYWNNEGEVDDTLKTLLEEKAQIMGQIKTLHCNRAKRVRERVLQIVQTFDSSVSKEAIMGVRSDATLGGVGGDGIEDVGEVEEIVGRVRDDVVDVVGHWEEGGEVSEDGVRKFGLFVELQMQIQLLISLEEELTKEREEVEGEGEVEGAEYPQGIGNTPKLEGPGGTFWAIDAILTHFSKQFVFHFQGEGETNRLDKPEFALNYVLLYLRNKLSLAKSVFAHSFATVVAHYGGIHGSFSTWFIKSILRLLTNKFGLEVNNLVLHSNHHLLSHLVLELKKFDWALKNEFNYIPHAGEEWNGLTNDLILCHTKVWNVWLQSEKDFVNGRFDEIINMDDAWQLDYDIVENGYTKPTKSSINLVNLLKSITFNYQSLPLKFQLKFLSEVQLKLLNFYFDTLKKGYYALKHIKTVQVDGVSTLERICRVWCSSNYIIETLDKWGDELIFIELWQSLNNREDDFKSTFFDSVINGYRLEIVNKIPKLITNYFDVQFNRIMKDYFQENADWINVMGNSLSVSTSVSSALDFIVATLAKDLQFLQRTVSTQTYEAWKLLVSERLANYIERNIIMANTFSIDGALKLQSHVEQIYHSLNLPRCYLSHGKLMASIEVLKGNHPSYPLNEMTVSMLVNRRG
ncbi:uncharacterized protein C5L36_0E04350 [Pichia kudriavzevii]|uniref:RAD50-interacting protein 1 n=1 Tax=Pichia kudriavzevii TaxID=4909 RepID=A0A2U9RA64_PICKU|nr:uncharacterized protein C5L36_0E04350 [Pichia kudriavzevii]AWU78380.1 hypothetical protein C5L36_0E04350 [Pichia kudriavzevii]